MDNRLLICAVLSLLAHFAIARGLEHLPPREDHPPPQRIEVRVIEPAPPAPPEEPKPEPKPEEPKPVPHELPKVAPHVATPQVAAVAKNTPAPDKPAFQADTTDEPVYGYNMATTSTVGTGPAIPVGNTTKADPGKPAAGPVKALAEPIAAAEATKLPLPEARCFGKYTEEAHTAGVEGTVVIDLIVGEDGRARDIEVRERLPAGLTEAAIKALKECQFTPGERDGKRVPVKIRGFKVKFVRPD